MQGRTYGSRVNQIWCALRGTPLHRRERQSARVSFPCFWGLALLVGRVSLRVLRGVDAALDKTRTPLTADTPARLSGHHHVASRAVFNNLAVYWFNGQEL
jgi:hypothetical protein